MPESSPGTVLRQLQQAQSFLPDAALSPQLQKAVTALNPNFNFQQSATNAPIQGGLAPAAKNATAQINNLQSALNGLPGLENMSSPIVNSFTRLASSLTGAGAGSTQAFTSALQDTRQAVQNALEIANGLTPTEAASSASQMFPDSL